MAARLMSYDHGSAPTTGVSLAVVAGALSFASGAVDFTAFTRLGAVFASVMTGNLVLLGLATEHASSELASHSAVAIVSFVCGVALGSLLCRNQGRSDVVWPARVTVVLTVEFAVLAGFTLGWMFLGGHPGADPQLPLLASAAVAMGLQSEAMRHLGPSVSTTYLTGTLTSTVASLAIGARGVRSERLPFVILASVAVGAAAGGGVVRLAPAVVPVLPLLALAAVIGLARTVGVRE